MFYYALVDKNMICTNVYAMPAPISGESYIQITEELYNDPSLIGKKYDNGEWVEVTKFYYAILDERNIVTSVYESETEMTGVDNMVSITFEQYNDPELIGKWYDAINNEFKVPTVDILAEMSTSQIQYKDENKWLDEKLDEMDAAIKAAGTGTPVEGHTHENKAVLDGITAEKVAAWDAVTGTETPVDAYTKEESDKKYALAGASYTKTESDERYALKDATGGSTMTAAEILAALKTVDGTNSGLDADTVDGVHGSDIATKTELNGKANASHDHAMDEVTGLETALAGKAPSAHTHTGYAAESHTHKQADIEGLATALSEKAEKTHTHDDYAPATHNHTGYAPTDHTHNGYAPTNHTHNGYAAEDHNHDMSDISGLSTALSGKASSNHSHYGEYADYNHSHSGYASYGHGHSEYLSNSGDTMNGDLDVKGVVRVEGSQAIYNDGSKETFGSNNLETYICGSKITSRMNITSLSDARVKDDVKPVDKERLIDFLKKVDFVSFLLKGDENKQRFIGVIAQQLLAIDEEIAKYFVRVGKDGFYSVDYTALALLAAIAVQ